MALSEQQKLWVAGLTRKDVFTKASEMLHEGRIDGNMYHQILDYHRELEETGGEEAHNVAESGDNER